MSIITKHMQHTIKHKTLANESHAFNYSTLADGTPEFMLRISPESMVIMQS